MKKYLALILIISFIPFQSVQASTFTVNTTDMTNHGACTEILCSLIDAIIAANDEATHPGTDIINLVPNSIYTVTSVDNNIWGPTGLPAITSTITINGNGATLQRDSYAPDFRLLIVDTSGNLTVNSLIVQGGSSNEGGAVFNFGLLQLTNVTLQNNRSLAPLGNLGGALGTVYGTTTVTDSIIRNNLANTGGAITNRAATTILNGTTVEDNNATTYGGAIWGGSSITLNNASILRNHAGDAGGGIFNEGGTFTISGSEIADNSAERGAGLFAEGSNVIVNISGSTISGNTATGQGGGIFYAPYYGTGGLTIDTSVLSQNSASYGGGIHTQHGGTVTITNTMFLSNMATSGYGGAFHAISTEITTGTFSLNQSCVVDNSTTSVMNETPNPSVDATNTWWGTSDGPSGVGPGSGDSVSTNVTFVPFLTTPPAGCPYSLIITHTPTATFTASPTPTFTSTDTPSSTSTPTVTATDTRTATFTSTSTQTFTPTFTATPTYTPTLTSVPFSFNGFFQPIDAPPTLNVMAAGRGVAVKFSLNGYQGLDIFTTGYPASSEVACGSTAEDAIEQTMTVGSNSLTYNASTDQYIYLWKTDKAWAGTCRTLVIKLSDGTYHRADFKFK